MRTIWSCAWLVTFTLLAFTLQEAVAAAQESYAGQPVAAVDLVSDPTINLQDLQALVEQKAGEPYSDQKIQASIAALNQTRKFSKVEVDVRPEDDGFHIMFILEPAFYYGIADFPGALHVFTYGQLLQVVNLPDEDPYQLKRVAQAQTDLEAFLRTNGYFQAQVQSSTHFDRPHGLANVIFQVKLGKRAKIGSVEVQGPPLQEAHRLLEAIRSRRANVKGASLRPGKTYTPERVKASTNLLRQYLIRHDHLASHVDVSPPRYHPDTNRADLTVSVDEGPRAEVRISGARVSWVPFLGGREKRKLIPIYREGSLDPDLVEEGTRNLTNYFQAKGYFDVRVHAALQQQHQKISVVYQVDRGNKHKIAQVAFQGNHHIDENELKEHIAIKKSGLLVRGKFNDTLLRKSINELKAVYVDRGFEEVSITPQVDDKEPKIDVTFRIFEGQQTQVDAVNFQGNKHFEPAALSPPDGCLICSGVPFAPGRLSKDRGRILAVYLNHGYLRADVKAKVNRHPDDHHKVDVTYEIDEGQQVRIEKVVIVGQKRTRRRLIAKNADLRTETSLSQGKLLQAANDLYNLGIFDWASVGPRRPITDQTYEEAVVKVHEAKRNTIGYGFGLQVSRRGASAPSGTVAVPGLPIIGTNGVNVAPSEATFVSPRGTFEFTRRNLRGLAETGSLSLVLARLDQRFLATLADPHLRNTRWSSLFSLSAEHTTENPLFAAQLETASVQVERPLNQAKTTSARVRYTFQKTDLSQILVPDLVLPQDQHVRLSGFSGSIIKDTRDKPLDAHRGVYRTVDVGINGKAIGASVNFARFLGQVAYYKEIGHGIVWANSVRLGLEKAYGNSDIPTSERFFSGGATTLRGFPTNGAGPQRIVPFCSNPSNISTCSNVTVPVGGPQLFIFNSEVRFPLRIVHNLGAVGFYDGGNVYDRIGIVRFAQDYANTVGVGLRYNTPIGPVRFDVGRNLNPVPGFRATQFFITLGQAF